MRSVGTVVDRDVVPERIALRPNAEHQPLLWHAARRHRRRGRSRNRDGEERRQEDHRRTAVSDGWLTLKNGEGTIGLFQGGLEKNILMFNGLVFSGVSQYAEPFGTFRFW
jgi:hypothetical protein